MSILNNHTFSYKMDVGVTPKWRAILQRQYPDLSEKGLDKFIADGVKKGSKKSLYGTKFHFTEYHGTASGLTISSAKQLNPDQSWEQNFVDECEVAGFTFDYDNKELVPGGDPRSRVRISADGIVAYTEQKILARLGRNPYAESVLSHIPLGLLKHFFIELGMGFRDLEMKPVIAWPQSFNSIFQRYNIAHFKWYASEPPVFDLARYNKHLWQRLGEPKVAAWGDNPSHRFETEFADYDIEIKIFQPKAALTSFESELQKYMGNA